MNDAKQSEGRQEHSKEPWQISLTRTNWLFDSENHLVAEIDGYDGAKSNVANAERIVACVNFCRGKSNQELGILSRCLDDKPDVPPIARLEEMNEALCAQLDEAKKENERLHKFAGATEEGLSAENERAIRALKKLQVWANQDPTGPVEACGIAQFVRRTIAEGLGQYVDRMELGRIPESVAEFESLRALCDQQNRDYKRVLIELQSLRQKLAEAQKELKNSEAIDHLAEACKERDEELFNLRSQLATNKAARVERPKIICLCGSTRFIEQFAIQTWELERQGNIVLGCTLLPMWYCKVQDHFGEATGTKEQCDDLHKRKIDLADEILVLNYDGYIGDSTRSEIIYAASLKKPVHFVEPDRIPSELRALVQQEEKK